MGSQCPEAELWWGNVGRIPLKALEFQALTEAKSCYPCIKSTEFIRNIKIKIIFGGSFREGGGAAPCPPPPGIRHWIYFYWCNMYMITLVKNTVFLY